jgi:hypothetical protein
MDTEEKSVILDGCVFHWEDNPSGDKRLYTFTPHKFEYWGWVPEDGSPPVCLTYQTTRPLRLIRIPPRQFNIQQDTINLKNDYHKRYDGYIVGNYAIEISIFNDRKQAGELFKLVKTERCDTIPDKIIEGIRDSFQVNFAAMCGYEESSNVYSLFSCFL